MWLCIVQNFGYEGWGHWIQESSTWRQQRCWGAGVGTWIEWLPNCFSLSCLRAHQQMGGEVSEVPVVVMSYCAGGKVPYQCCKKDIGYFIKNMRSESDPPVSRMTCPSRIIRITPCVSDEMHTGALFRVFSKSWFFFRDSQNPTTIKTGKDKSFRRLCARSWFHDFARF